MKNLKVRLKILVSFGIIIAMILVFSAFVVYSNLSTGKFAGVMRYETQMQSLCTDLVDAFSQANAGINILNYSFDESEYTHVLANISACKQTLLAMNAYIAQEPDLSVYQVEVDAVSASIDAWGENLNEILALNKEMEAIIADARSVELSLESQSMGIFDYQMELSRDEASQDIEESARLRRVNRIEQGMDISNRLKYIGSSCGLMFASLDILQAGENREFFDETVEILTEFHDESALQYNIDTSAAMLDSLADYSAIIEGFLSCFRAREALMLAGQSKSAEALGSAYGLVAAVKTHSLANAEATIGMASTSLLVTIIIVAAGLTFSILLAIYLSGMISKPLQQLSAFMNKAGSLGDIALTPEDVENISRLTKLKDEIGEAIAGCAAFVGHVTSIAEELETIANGDLSVEHRLLSDKDTMGLSLNKMVDSFNSMFSDIHASTNQVSNGTKQVADGAQSLAQGSTEQAASVEELSASISKIAQITRENAATAEETSKLSTAIKVSAEKGSRQMDDMISAVSEINDASRNIGRIIKTIDDIAFQTNILALNAAVEAARAGQHGKGFAVVAEEVRNLASKSAEAAKDTGDMIQNSMEKAELGSRIAGETSVSLNEIVEGINKSGELIAEIARSSDDQSQGINQINDGIDQVARVVQQNSATAEESAAASEEMSGQADMLQQLIAQFKLKEGSAEYRGLPASGKPAGRQLDPDFGNGGGDEGGFGKY